MAPSIEMKESGEVGVRVVVDGKELSFERF